VGHRRNRKAERRQRQTIDFAMAAPVIVGDDDLFGLEQDFEIFGLGRSGSAPAVRACGGCREFVEDREGGRGTCLHPGSGIFAPWTDTPACDFYARRRGG
jgi:hypothetical protein